MWIRHESKTTVSPETGASAVSKQGSDVATALCCDPAVDHQNSAETLPHAIPSHGACLNSVLYTAAGAGPHPTILLLHGLPGNEQNVDFAQAARRAGWNVLVIHYRGSWGDHGDFTLTHCLEDAAASLDWLRNSAATQKHRINRRCIAIIGHSMGGYIAAHTAAGCPSVAGVALISAADPGQAFGSNGSQDVSTVDKTIGYSAGLNILAQSTPTTLAQEAHRLADSGNITKYAQRLLDRPLLVITSDDGFASHGESLCSAVHRLNGANVTQAHFADDHSYSGCRIALQMTLLQWLETLVQAGISDLTPFNVD